MKLIINQKTPKNHNLNKSNETTASAVANQKIKMVFHIFAYSTKRIITARGKWVMNETSHGLICVCILVTG
jgi:hypothetical protein